MTYGGAGIAAQIARRGGKADVLVYTKTGSNDFGNTTKEYIFDREILIAKTYPNRNTSVESNIGDLGQDRPVFMVPVGHELPEPPAEGDHILFNGDEYAVNAHTPYDTHVEFFGEPVIHDDG